MQCQDESMQRFKKKGDAAYGRTRENILPSIKIEGDINLSQIIN